MWSFKLVRDQGSVCDLVQVLADCDFCLDRDSEILDIVHPDSGFRTRTLRIGVIEMYNAWAVRSLVHRLRMYDVRCTMDDDLRLYMYFHE